MGDLHCNADELLIAAYWVTLLRVIGVILLEQTQ